LLPEGLGPPGVRRRVPENFHTLPGQTFPLFFFEISNGKIANIPEQCTPNTCSKTASQCVCDSEEKALENCKESGKSGGFLIEI
jgi:hypothetical protein